MGEITRYGIGTATYLELVWLLVGVLGTFNMLLLFLAAVGDWEYLKREGINGTRSIVARSSVITIGAKLLVVVGYAIVGFVASALPPVNPDRQYTPSGIVLTGAFMVGTLALNGAAVFQRHSRNRILEIEAERDRQRLWNGIDRRALEQ